MAAPGNVSCSRDTARTRPSRTAARFPRRGIVLAVVEQHVEDAGVLHATRTNLITAPHVKLHHLRRFDDRLEVHLDGLSIAGEHAFALCDAALETPDASPMFVAAVRALQEKRADWLNRLFALAEAVVECRRGFFSAFGWLGPEHLRGGIAELLDSSEPMRRLAGIAASAMHRVDPSLAAARRFEDPEPTVRARAWRTAGELGKHQLVSTVAAAIGDADPACQFWAAWSAVLLGDKQSALDLLKQLSTEAGPFQARAFQLAIQAMNASASHALLQPLAQDPTNARCLIRGAGLVGDPTYVPWLIGLMVNDSLARIAGEAFSLITGLDLAWLDLERKPPENFESGPNDDPNDPNVEIDEDDGLPWPDQSLVQTWWSENSHRFQSGARYFMGEPLNPANCVRVLKEGFQRQRIAAALYLSLLNPGTPLFEWRAPAARQARMLAQI